MPNEDLLRNENLKKNRKKEYFSLITHFFVQKYDLSLPPQNLKMQINPDIYKIFSILFVLMHALLKLFLYGNIVSINSTIMVRRMVCMVKKIKNLIKAYRVLKILFLSNFCQLTSIFMVFQRKKM